MNLLMSGLTSLLVEKILPAKLFEWTEKLTSRPVSDTVPSKKEKEDNN